MPTIVTTYQAIDGVPTVHHENGYMLTPAQTSQRDMWPLMQVFLCMAGRLVWGLR